MRELNLSALLLFIATVFSQLAHGEPSGFASVSAAQTLLRLAYPNKCHHMQRNSLSEEEASIQIFLPGDVLAKVQQKGVLNYHQVNAARRGLDLYAVFRRRVENSFLAVDIDRIFPSSFEANFLRPKYGILSFENRPLLSQPNRRIPEVYGSGVAVLKKELLQRTTLSVGDSLNTFAGRDDLSLFGNCGNIFEKPIYYMFKGGAQVQKVPSFVEAQVWGRILPEDIDYFIVNCPGRGKLTSKRDLKRIAATHKVYECVVEEINGNDARVGRGRSIRP